MSERDKSSHANGFWPGSPFTGARPESLALIEADIEGEGKRSLQAVAKALPLELSKLCARHLRWQIGLGPALFERFPWLERPGLLKNLQLNEDALYEFEPGSGESQLLIAFGGSWSETVSATQALIRDFKRLRLSLRAVNLGHDEATERDHSGFLDGTSNLQELTPAQFSASVFVQAGDDKRFVGGSYMVLRKYEEDLEMWNDLPEFVQEHFIGRRKQSGSFMDEGESWSPRAWEATHSCAHIRRVHSRQLEMSHPDYWKERIYRRGIKFTERKTDGALRHGLLFIALVRDPEAQFAHVHNERLLPDKGEKDFLLSSGYIKPMRSGCYFLPRALSQLQSTLCGR